MPNIVKEFSDLDLNFIPHPVYGDIIPLKNTDAVRRSVRNLMFMGFYDRPNEPDLGANLKQLLFEPINPLTEETIKTQIENAITRYEPRVTILETKVEGDLDENGYQATLTFIIDEISEAVTITQFLERVR